MDKTEHSWERMARTPGDVVLAAIDQPESVLGHRPAAGAWAVKEVVCHLRDVEEFYLIRTQTILTNEEPRLVLLDPDRWATDRQYLRNDFTEALDAFRVRREETLVLLRSLSPAQLERGAIHPIRGRITIANIIHSMAKHDDVHLAQIKRALRGEP
jgi:uncharacterized damage-inducible protein DinB